MYYRRLPVEGANNIRDLGGYACCGGVTRFGRLLRADCLSGLTASDTEMLLKYGLRSVLDLRDDAESLRKPDVFSAVDGVKYTRIPLVPDAADTNVQFIRLSDMYLAIARDTPQLLISCVKFIMRGLSSGAVLFHCAAGKDRTGILAALLLEALGVSRADIIADYQISNTYIQPYLAKLPLEVVPEAFRLSEPCEIIRFLDFVAEQGGAKAYLLKNGVSEAELSTFSKSMVDTEKEQ